MTTLYTSNDATIGFDALATGAVPSNGAAVTGTWQVGTVSPVNGHSHSFGDTITTDGQVWLYSGITATADLDLVYAQKNTGVANNVGAILRSDSGFANAYLGLVQQTSTTGVNIFIFKRISNSFSSLGSFTGTLSSATAPFFVRMQTLGTTIRVKAWSLGSNEPTTFQASVTDSTVTAAGFAGFYNEESTSPALVSVSDVVLSSLTATALTVDTPATQTASASVTLTGTYTGTAPTGVDYAFDGGTSFTALASFSAAANSWSGTATAPATAGLHWANVRNTGTTTATAASATFTVNAPAATITVTTPGSVNAGAAMTISGTYTGTAPTGINFRFDSASFTAASSPTISGGTWSFTTTAPAAGSHTVTVQEANATSVTATSGTFASIATAITVTTPGAQTFGGSMTVSGTYTGVAPTGLNVQIDSGSFSAASSPTISGGNFSFAITVPAVGTHTITVQEANATAVTSTSGNFPVSTAATITVTTPATQVAGFPMTVSGTYGGTAPTGLNMQFDSAGFTTVASPTISGGTYSFSVAAPSATGSHTVSVQEANATAVTATSGSFTVNANTIAPNNTALLYSPYNWNVSAGSAQTINAGAYVRTLFTGASCTLNFNTSNNLTPLSEIWWRIDGPAGPWTQANVAATIALTIPAATTGNADIKYHLLEMMVKSTTETQNRWNAPSNTAVTFTGLTLAAGAAVQAPAAAPLNLLFLGDSITEGVRTLGEAASNDTDRNDAMASWATPLATMLGGEIGLVGFGGQGLSVAGSGNVPTLGSSYSLLSAGVSRTFSPTPALVVINIGTNDGATNTIVAMTSLLNGLITACPTSKIAVLRPFGGNQATNLQAAIAACSNPSAVTYIDTTGMFNPALGSDSGSTHPSCANNLGQIAPQLAAALRPILAGSSTRAFRGGFQVGRLG